MPQSEDPEEQLASFLAKYTPEIASRAKAIRARMRILYPTALELVYDNYNALAIGYGPTEKSSEAIFSIALFPRWVSLFFLQAAGLLDPDKLLRGSGSVARHVVLPSADALGLPAIQALMREAQATAKAAFNPNGTHRLIIKAISEKQKPRRPAATSAPRPASAKSRNAGSKPTERTRKP